MREGGPPRGMSTRKSSPKACPPVSLLTMVTSVLRGPLMTLFGAIFQYILIP
jgi:hypothetical protein